MAEKKPLDLRGLALQVKELRDAQIKFFQYKKSGNVNTRAQFEICLALEKKLDETIRKILNAKPDQPELFQG